MTAFYDLDEKQMECSEFISYYNKFYYNDYPAKIKGVSQSSRHIEQQIEKVLTSGIKGDLDVVHILAWKIGKIRHQESENKKSFVYYSDWKDADKLERHPGYDSKHLKLKFRNNSCQESQDLSPLIDYVVKTSKSYSKWTNKRAEEVLDEMKEKAPSGVGAVYLVALLYFMSKGYYPIYDQFADRAVKAITKEMKIGFSIKPEVLPEKADSEFGKKLIGEESYYISTYKDSIAKIFGGYDKYRGTREIDRALWVYGHLLS